MARKKRMSKSTRRTSTSKQVFFSKENLRKNITVVLNNLLLFLALSLVFLVFYQFLQNAVLKDLFGVMSMVFATVFVALLITLLILLIVKIAKKK